MFHLFICLKYAVIILVVIAGSIITSIVPAWSVSMYDLELKVSMSATMKGTTFSITDPMFPCAALCAPDGEFVTTIGNAISNANSSIQFTNSTIGHSAELVVEAAGSSDLPLVQHLNNGVFSSVSRVTSRILHGFNINNLSNTEDLPIDLSIQYEWSRTFSSDFLPQDPNVLPRESAFAHPILDIIVNDQGNFISSMGLFQIATTSIPIPFFQEGSGGTFPGSQVSLELPNFEIIGPDQSKTFWLMAEVFGFATTTTVPEPSTMILFGTGVAGLGVWRYRKCRSA